MLLNVVAVLAILQFLVFGIMVGQARTKYGIKAPATSGHDMYERLHRIHMNTLELLVCLLPAMYLAAQYWSHNIVALGGVVYLVGRIIYRNAYLKDPNSRTLGFALSVAPIMILLLAALVGVVVYR